MQKFRPSSVAITVGMFVVVLALFFIPEIINMQSYLQKGELPELAEVLSLEEEDKTKKVSVVKEDVVKEGGVEWESPLERILASLKTGEAFEPPPLELADLDVIGTAPEQMMASLSTIRSELSMTEKDIVEPKPEISWGNFKQRETLREISDARRKIFALRNDIPENRRGSRHALLEFATALKAVGEYDGREGDLRAAEALMYLEFLEVEATRALLHDRVDRNVYLRWTEISFGKPFEHRDSLAYKKDRIPPFRPQLIIDEFRLNFIRDTRTGNVTSVSVLGVRGNVYGDDVESVTVRSGDRTGSAFLAKEVNDDGSRRVSTRSRLDGRQVLTFIVKDRIGETYSKSYRFYPRAESGQFKAPPGGERQFDRLVSITPHGQTNEWGMPGQQRPLFTTMNNPRNFTSF